MTKIYPPRNNPNEKMCDCTHTKFDHNIRELRNGISGTCRICMCPNFKEPIIYTGAYDTSRGEPKEAQGFSYSNCGNSSHCSCGKLFGHDGFCLPDGDEHEFVINDDSFTFRGGDGRKYLISAVGMPRQQLDELEAEMNSGSSNKYIWIVDKPVTSVEVKE